MRSSLLLALLLWGSPAFAAGPVLDHCTFEFYQDPDHDLRYFSIARSATHGGPYGDAVPYPLVGPWYPNDGLPAQIVHVNTIDICNLWHWPDGQWYVTITPVGYSGGVGQAGPEIAFVLQRGTTAPTQPPGGVTVQ